VITVTLQWPNRRTRETLLEGIPRIGDHIEPNDNPRDPGASETLVVEMITWTEGRMGQNGEQSEPNVIISVHPYKSSPRD
jgi:hypothetical protein